MLLLGIDVGTSSIKVSVVDAQSQQAIASAQYPEDTENKVISVRAGYAEQDPDMWWEHTQLAIAKVLQHRAVRPEEITAIGIAYQMHGLVVIDEERNPLRNSIIWCDSRAVDLGEEAFQHIGNKKSLDRLLNSPGNFTAAKWAWVKQNEPAVYKKAYKIMLPGDFIALKLTGDATTSISALSEGVFWDFRSNSLSTDIMEYFGFDEGVFPELRPLFGEHGFLQSSVARKLNLKPGIPVTYKSGDQPNNALSLNVLRPGEVAATAGTSGVIFAVSDQLISDKESRINTFAHVNYTKEDIRTGVLLCINGTGILNSWVKQNMGQGLGYDEINKIAQSVPPGSEGLSILPFGNGAERIFNNRIIGSHFLNLDFNHHHRAHVFRAAQEGIAFAFRYGLDILRENGMNPSVIRAGIANMFQSELFTQIFANVTNTPVELYNNDGSIGAALGAGIGNHTFASPDEAFEKMKVHSTIVPQTDHPYEEFYSTWRELLLEKFMQIKK
ncbi:xylulokinase [Albibacterium indicum]|uniref:xylulokinase n=1 Tax=Albibacterium indicum TaxID=2292082 RepID=UPI000E529EE0|nr:FGGY family carbohydrate kinase [Pedobacter indicus]